MIYGGMLIKQTSFIKNQDTIKKELDSDVSSNIIEKRVSLSHAPAAPSLAGMQPAAPSLAGMQPAAPSLVGMRPDLRLTSQKRKNSEVDADSDSDSESEIKEKSKLKLKSKRSKK